MNLGHDVNEQPEQLGLGAMAEALHQRKLSASELTARAIMAIEACPDQAIFINLTKARALREAAASDARRARGATLGPLDGLPIAHKALIDLSGEVTSAASMLLARTAPPAERDADVAAALSAAGMVTLGHVNMTELAFSALGLNPHFGTPRNPHGADGPRVPGGSSSGSAVAVARRLVPAATGSDTGGSIRTPAAFNGILGFKGSSGRYSMRGIFPLAPTLDTLGPLARSMADIALLDAGMRGAPLRALTPQPLRGQHVIAPTNIVLDDLEPAVASMFADALQRLERAGAKVERRAMPELDAVLATYDQTGQISNVEALAFHRDLLARAEPGDIDRRVVASMQAASQILAVDYLATLAARRRLVAATKAEWGTSLIAMPTLPHVAPLIAPLEADDELFRTVNLLTLRNPMLGNFLDVCALSLPMGCDARGLPAGFMLCAASGQDDHLLAAGQGIAAAITP